MFSTSTQRKFWLFSSTKELEELRQRANEDYIIRRQTKGPIVNEKNFLTTKEESYYIKHNLNILYDVCKKFQPTMLKSVIGTAFQYFKRFYLTNSCMEYLPKNIAVTCFYLACKVDEFNVNINQFVSNLKGDGERAADIVLSNELLLMQKLKYHLTVHNPYRSIEGLLIDLKTRGSFESDDIEELRSHIDDYIDRVMFTDACFLFTPSQIALSSIIFGASNYNMNIEPYLADVLFHKKPDKLMHIKDISEAINGLLQSQENPTKDIIKSIDKKLKHVQIEETTNKEETNED